MKKPDYSTWLTKSQAAGAIGVSTKQVERWAQEKRLQVAKWKRPEGGPAIVVYHPQEVEQIARERNPQAEAFVLPHAEVPQSTGSTAVAIRQPSAEQFLQAITAAVSGMSQTSETGVRLADKLYLTLAQAAEYTGLGSSYLRQQIESGKLALKKGAGPRGAGVIRRADLEEL